MQNKKIIILANAAVNNGNRGCLALSYCAIYLIDDICKSNGIEYELYLTDSNLLRKAEKAIKINNQTIHFKTCSYPIGFSAKSVFTYLYRFKETIHSMRVFKRSDVIFDIGHGDSFADIYGGGRFNMVDKIHKTARFFRKPYILLPQTIGPFDNRKIKKEADKTISRAFSVMARDKISYDYVVNNTSQVNVKEYIDIAFFLPYTKSQFDSKYINVGINVSALLWNGGYNKNNQFELKTDYKELIKEIISYFIGKSKVKLHLVSHVVNHVRNIENDYAIAFDLKKELPDDRVVLAPLFLTPIDAKDYISGLDFFMGSRMHATIAAFSSGVPVIPIAYSRKFNGLFKDTLDYEYMVDLKNSSNEEAFTMIKSSFEKRMNLKDIIQARLYGIIREKKVQLHQDLTKFLLL